MLTPQDIQQIQQMIQQENQRGGNRDVFNVQNIPFHTHNGVDSQQINQSSVIPGTRVLGDVTMEQDGVVYTLGLNFNPTSMTFLGAAIGTSDKRAMIVGNVQFGSTYILQASSSTAVTTGGPKQRFIQGSTQFIQTAASTFAVNTSELYIASLTSDTRLEVVNFTDKSVQVKCLLGTGWTEFVGTFVVT